MPRSPAVVRADLTKASSPQKHTWETKKGGVKIRVPQPWPFPFCHLPILLFI